MQVTTIGFDIAKNVFHVHASDAKGRFVFRKTLRRAQILRFFAGLEPCLVGMEACGSAHYWGRALQELGHEVRLMTPTYVKAYVKRGNKTDPIDAEAICEAVGRPSMRFVPIKSPQQQAILTQHRTRDRLIRQRTMQINALRTHLVEFGIVAAQGKEGFKTLVAHVEQASSEEIPEEARLAMQISIDTVNFLDRQVAVLDKQVVAANKANPVARRLMTIPGIGPITASALAAMVGDPGAFANGRHFAAWLGLVPSQHGTGGKVRLGRITKRGDRYLRRLLVTGATSLIRRKQPEGDPFAAQLARLTAAGKCHRVASVAMANKLARIAWAVLARSETYNAAKLAAA